MKRVERWLMPGERVRVWYKSAREWKLATVRALVFDRSRRSGNPSFYQITCEGKENPRYYRREELQLLNGHSSKGRTTRAARSSGRTRRTGARA
jgi:hypothetical protein